MPLGCNHFWDSYDTPEEAIEEAQKEYDKNGKLDDFDIFYDKQVTNDKFKTNIIEIRPTQEIDVNMGIELALDDLPSMILDNLEANYFGLDGYIELDIDDEDKLNKEVIEAVKAVYKKHKVKAIPSCMTDGALGLYDLEEHRYLTKEEAEKHDRETESREK